MSRGFPSMTALLGLLAIAGYQNRDKLAEMLGGGAPNQGRLPGQVVPLSTASQTATRPTAATAASRKKMRKP